MATKRKKSQSKKAMTIETEMKEIEKNRNNTYGSIHNSHTQYGRVWSGILSSHFEEDMPDIPGHVVALMLSAMKICRASVNRKYREDNVVDGMNYFGFVPRLDPRSPDFEEVEDE